MPWLTEYRLCAAILRMLQYQLHCHAEAAMSSYLKNPATACLGLALVRQVERQTAIMPAGYVGAARVTVSSL